MKQTDQAQDEDEPHQQGTCFISDFVQSEFWSKTGTQPVVYQRQCAKYPKLVVFISHKPTWAGCIPPDDNKTTD